MVVTKQTAMVIYGLTDYLKATKELNAQPDRDGIRERRPVLTKKLDQATGAQSAGTRAGREQACSRASITYASRRRAKGRLYYSARARILFDRRHACRRPVTMSLNILRDYFRLVPAKDGEKIVYDTAPLNGPVASGDMIAVRLTVTGSEWKYMMVEDPIPAGTEFIERDNLYEFEIAAAVVGSIPSPGANCMTIAWRSSRLTSRRASSSISIC